MEVRTPRPSPIEDGDYKTYTDAGYGNAYGTIHLAEGYGLDLADVHVEDCDRLIRAASKVREQLLGFQAEAAAPHGRKHLWHSTCQLCGKPEGDGLHAEAGACTSVAPETGRPCTETGEHVRHRNGMTAWGPGINGVLGAQAALAASVAAGVPLAVYDDEPRRACGHQQTQHDEGPDSRCNAVACRCARFTGWPV